MADKNLSKFEKQRQKDKAKFEKERDQWKKQDTRKRKKKSRKVDLAPIVIKVAAIVIAAALVLGVCAMYASSYGFPGRFIPTLSVAGKTVFQPEYTYQYYNEYQRHYANAQRYAGYANLGLNLSYFGFSLTELPFGLPVTGMEEGEEDTTWDEFLREQSTQSLQALYALLAEAKKAGLSLSAEDQAAIQEEIDNLKATANGHALSLNAYLRMSNHPPGINQRFLRGQMEREMLRHQFHQSKLAEFRTGYDMAQLRAEYDEDTSAHDFVDLRILPFAKIRALDPESEDEEEDAYEARLAAANAEIMAEAEAFLTGLSDSDSFAKAAEALHADDEDFDALATEYLLRRKSELDSMYKKSDDDKLSDWVYDAARRAGDATVYEDAGNYYAVMLTRPAYAVKLTDFRSQLVQVQDLEFLFSEELVSHAVNEAYEQAQAVLEEWEAEAPAGTLVERYAPSSADAAQMTQLDEWLFAQERKEGEGGIVPVYDNNGVLSGLRVVWLEKLYEDEYSWTAELSGLREEADFAAYLEELLEKNPATERRVGMWFSMRALRPLIESFIILQVFGGF